LIAQLIKKKRLQKNIVVNEMTIIFYDNSLSSAVSKLNNLKVYRLIVHNNVIIRIS